MVPHFFFILLLNLRNILLHRDNFILAATFRLRNNGIEYYTQSVTKND